jgi:hypothetical protein
MKNSFQEYHVDLTKIEECLPWGGLIHPAILRNKDDSLMGFFQYTAREDFQHVSSKLAFRNGWSLWTEKQHMLDPAQDINQFYITLVWNPFFNKEGRIFNTLDHKMRDRENRIPYFYQILQEVETSFKNLVDLHILTYDAILAYLRSALSFGPRPVPTSSIPLYLDALLSQDLNFTVRKNDVEIDGKSIGIITPLGYPDIADYMAVFKQYEKIPYRFVRRSLFCDDSSFQREQKRYMSNWCSGRSSMLHFIKDRIQGQISGYDTRSFLFLYEDQQGLQRILKEAEAVLTNLGIPSIVEDFNKKDIFWGSLPGLFRANIEPPVTKIEDFTEFFLCGQPQKKKEAVQNV